ncbi:hypothetical protein FNV43_RR21046 [Rhamnella rubrinervis]|uniref:Uncharacterized protein n=1 Tax=Rhamnella rubrinervis TaxID=2594499 RepID=A0A8K0E2L2_9ROSA|nr:hypothetical protein FNV43_RR21046 [Rhamnella rubrinervis]
MVVIAPQSFDASLPDQQFGLVSFLKFKNFDMKEQWSGYSRWFPEHPYQESCIGFSSNGSSSPNTVTRTSDGESPLVLTPLAQCFPSPKSEIEQDDLPWLTKGASVRGEQVVLSESEMEVENVGMVASSGIPIGAKGDDAVMVDAPAPISLELVNYELKDLHFNISKEEVEQLRHFCKIPHTVTFRRPEKREGPLDGKEREIAMYSASLELFATSLAETSRASVDPSVVDAIKNISFRAQVDRDSIDKTSLGAINASVQSCLDMDFIASKSPSRSCVGRKLERNLLERLPGAPVQEEQVVLSDSEMEVKGAGVVAGSRAPIEVEGDDVVMVDASTPIPFDPINYELKDLLFNILEEEVKQLRNF